MSDLLAAIGGFARYADKPFDERIELPLAEQVDALMKWACSQQPERFRRSVPVNPRDHDVLITHALTKLVLEVERLRGEVAKAHVLDEGDDKEWWCRCGDSWWNISSPTHVEHVAAILNERGTP